VLQLLCNLAPSARCQNTVYELTGSMTFIKVSMMTKMVAFVFRHICAHMDDCCLQLTGQRILWQGSAPRSHPKQALYSLTNSYTVILELQLLYKNPCRCAQTVVWKRSGSR
jgi:hypothetical protein